MFEPKKTCSALYQAAWWLCHRLIMFNGTRNLCKNGFGFFCFLSRSRCQSDWTTNKPSSGRVKRWTGQNHHVYILSHFLSHIDYSFCILLLSVQYLIQLIRNLFSFFFIQEWTSRLRSALFSDIADRWL